METLGWPDPGLRRVSSARTQTDYSRASGLGAGTGRSMAPRFKRNRGVIAMSRIAVISLFVLALAVATAPAFSLSPTVGESWGQQVMSEPGECPP